MVLDYHPVVWPPWNGAENSKRQTRKLSLTLPNPDSAVVAILKQFPIAPVNEKGAVISRLNGPSTLPPSQFANFPNVEIDPFGSNLGPYSLSPQGYVQNVYQAVENVSYIRGKHTFKFGVEGRNYITETTSLPRARGEWDYASLNSLINDFVPDGANGALRGAGTASSANNNPAVYWFVQDDWKVLPRLTVNLGF